MQVISTYPKSPYMHQVRLFLNLRPLLRKRKDPTFLLRFQKILEENCCIIDSAGWLLSSTADIVESKILAKKYCKRSKIFDYTIKSLQYDFVFAFDPELLRYVDVKTFEQFLINWTTKKLVIYFDKRLIFHNYFKYDLKDIVDLPNLSITETVYNDKYVKWEIVHD